MSKLWSKEKNIELFDLVEKTKQSNKPILSAFKTFASQYNYSYQSVRNYFYKNIKELCKHIGKQLTISHQQHFSKLEFKDIEKVCYLVSSGYSVRNACMLVGQTPKNALRLQNKYRWLLKKDLLTFTPRNVSIKSNKATKPNILKPDFVDKSKPLVNYSRIVDNFSNMLLNNSSIKNIESAVSDLVNKYSDLYNKIVSIEKFLNNHVSHET